MKVIVIMHGENLKLRE